MSLRIGIVGAGAMADYHAQRFASIPGVEVVACCDHSPEKAAAFAVSRGIGIIFPDAEAMVDSGRVDAISIASADIAHASPALAALGRGLPVFCEKPLARRLSDATEMAQAAEASGIPTIVNFSKRNGGALSLARRLIRDGALGRVQDAEFLYLQSWLIQNSWGDWRSTPRWRWRLDDSISTYGALGDLGSHLFDAALFLFGDLSTISCSAKVFDANSGESHLVPKKPAFESFSAVLSGGVEALASSSFRSPGNMDTVSMTLRGDAASLFIDFSRSRTSLRVVTKPNTTGDVITASAQPSTYERFVILARGGVDPVADEDTGFRQGLAVQRLVSCCAGLAGNAEAVT